jgi:hypothetical protein
VSTLEWLRVSALEVVWVWVWASASDLVLVFRIPATDPVSAGLFQASAAALELEWVQVVAAVPYRHRVLQKKAHH